ncbi:MAG TPA: AzlD domain-containing protein [bacterium]|nr:AzlD domain-containing protein [bacterium]
MSIWILVALGALTYASRAAALVLLPDPPVRMRRFLERIPAPLFASLAATALFTPEGTLGSPALLAATAGALVAARSRSLLLILFAGLIGYVGYTAGLLLIRP